MRRRQGHREAAAGYAELQVTTNFSFLRGGSHAHELVERAQALGLAAIAVVDRNTLAGVVRAHTAARAAGLRVITGARLDLRDAPSLLCLPQDRAAYGRLSRLLSLGQGRAEKGACILDLDDVAAHAEGQVFIALAPDAWCWREALTPATPPPSPPQPPAASPVSAQVIAFPGSRRGAAEAVAPALPAPPAPRPKPPPAGESFEQALYRIRDALAPAARLYLAATHLYRGDDLARIAALSNIAGRVGVELVATNDVLYHTPERRPLQDVLTCVREKTTIAEAGLQLAANAERHLKSPAEMARLFRGHARAVANTLAIAEACRFSLDELAYEYPDEPVPPGETPQSQLEKLAWDGARWRFPGGVPEKVANAITRELALIAELEYAPYFLTVHDIVQFARSRGILCQGRGSAANSAVCYCIAITSVDPSEVDLLFERFISSERKEPPDIDVDFEHERREEVIQYIYARYGRDRAGLAATVISYRARSAVREVGKAMGLSEDTVTALAGMVWGTRSGGVLPEKHVREAGLDPADPLLRAVLALTFELMGFPRHLSQHVGGFVLTRGPLTEVVPVGNAAMDARTFIEWDKDDLQALGLLKVDVLALGMLSCIRRAFEFLDAHHDRRMTLANVPRNDAEVYEMLCRADSIGVFQVESRAQMNMLPRLKPCTYYDLVIEVAIVRPGPIQGDMVHPYLRRRDGLEAETYPAPAPEHGPPDELRQILGKTKGVPLFQEQAMRIAMEAARFDDAEVNELRQALATFRRRGTIHLLEEKMISRMVARGYEKEFAERCFNQIKGFGEYGFPESHAASFAHLVYVSSWLKWHYPAAFCAAILNAQPMGFYAPAQLVRDAREHGVEVRPVDVNFSDWDATLEAGAAPGRPAVRLGLRLVDGLRREEADKILSARQALEARHAPEARAARAFGGQRAGGGFVAFRSLEDLVRATRALPASYAVAASPGDQGAPLSPAVQMPQADQADLLLAGPTVSAAPVSSGAATSHASPSSQVSQTSQTSQVSQTAQVSRAALERLAAADAFRSMGRDRRAALWDARGLEPPQELPLFSWAESSSAGAEVGVALPQMPLAEHVVNDYQTLRLSLKAHPVSFLRPRLVAQGAVSCADIRALQNGRRVAVVGAVLIRQRPGTAKGVVFMTIEDETGVANIVVWAKTMERFRKVIMTARLIEVHGVIQRHEDIIHIISARLVDRNDWLAELSDQDEAMPVALANADEVRRPDPGSARAPDRPRWAGHPRNERILPKSRDFH